MSEVLISREQQSKTVDWIFEDDDRGPVMAMVKPFTASRILIRYIIFNPNNSFGAVDSYAGRSLTHKIFCLKTQWHLPIELLQIRFQAYLGESLELGGPPITFIVTSLPILLLW